MKTFSLVFTGGETYTLPAGNFFKILSSTAVCDVEFFKNNTDAEEPASDVEAGYSVRPLIARAGGDYYFDKIKVSSAVAQTVVVAISRGYGDYDRTVGTVDINSFSATAISSITAPEMASTSYYRASASSALNTIVTPAANLNGIRITTMSFAMSSGSGSVTNRVMMKTSAPSSISDGVGIAYRKGAAPTYNHNQLSDSHVTCPCIVPAGYGLYEQGSSGSTSIVVDITYEVL